MSSAISEQGDADSTRPDPPSASAATPRPARHPFRIGPYAVIGQIGRGAMGMVYAAYDEKLDRKVALKLLHSLQDTGTLGRARLLREAQALARVSHPNVVQVYEVGEHDGEIFIAMEFVRGATLRAWARERPRTWREVLAVYLGAGRGLAAAHAAGLVHRDFKPDNVMIGDDGRVRVMDFGLARTLGNTDSELAGDTLGSHDSSLSPTLTAEGTLLGTPAYMAPEQYARGTIDAQSDQFAYCVALFEALYGQRPFAGGTLRDIAASVTRGEVREPLRRAGPRWLRQIVARGLATEASQRWPNMSALLDRIERGQALARLRFATILVAILGLAVASAWVWYEADRARREAACAAAGAGIEEVWNDDVRAQVRDAFLRTGAPDAAATFDRVRPWLDRQAEAWRSARTEACVDAELRGLWTQDILDRSLWCLDERRLDLESLVTELSRADRAALQKAVPAAAGLELVVACRDALTLTRLPAPPLEGRDEARAVRVELSRLGSLEAAGRIKEIAGAAAATVARAEALGWPPLSAEARFWAATALDRTGKYEEAERAFEDVGFAAVQAGALGVAADVAIAMVTLVGQKRARFDDGLRWARLAELALFALEPRPGLRSAARLSAVAVIKSLTGAFAEAKDLQERVLSIYDAELGPDHLHASAVLHNLAITHLNLGKLDEALAVNGRALAIREAVLGPDHNDVARTLSNRAVILRNQGKYDEALALILRVLATTEQVLGPEHPDVGVVLTNLANVHLQRGTRGEVQALHERALAIREKALGSEHPDVAATLSNLGNFLQMTGEYARARDMHRRALAIREKAFGPEHREVANSLSNLALAERYLDHAAAAQPLQERALAILEKVLGPEHPTLAAVLVNLGELDREANKLSAAEAHYRRGVALIEATLGRDHPDVEPALRGLAEVALARRRPADAIPLAERAVATAEARGAAAKDSADVRFVLARALWDAPARGGRDRGRALAEARTARDGFRGVKGAEGNLATIERWLAKHRK